jgi:predicted glycogen debranching enzyme
MSIRLEREHCGSVAAALQREWLVTNGIGGFACGTVAGALTRRYHGLLIAALDPPVARTLLVAKLDDTAILADRVFKLYTNVWDIGVESPNACAHLASFEVDDGIATWTFDLDGEPLVRRVWMEHGRNVTYVTYEWRSPRPLRLTCRLLVNFRDDHVLRRADERRFKVVSRETGLTVRASDGAPHLVTETRIGPLSAPAGDNRSQSSGSPATARVVWHADHTWYNRFQLPVEAARGFDYIEDHLCAGRCESEFAAGTLTFTIAAGDEVVGDPSGAYERERRRAGVLIEKWARAAGIETAAAPATIRQLVLAAAQFVVSRPSAGVDGHTVIAGYPWFTDWGRDTMISLPGLTLATGRTEIAREVLLTWAGHVDRGMIPNRFPDRRGAPEYHTADATLWYLWAIEQYVRATDDRRTLRELFPIMEDVIAWHRRGTRHNIHADDDGLLYAGEPGVNLTWMDAKIGDYVVTPRIGKAVEVSALWYNALRGVAELARLIQRPADEYEKLADRVRESFARFWNPARECCFDVIDGPGGADPSLRPNQIFAVALDRSPLARDQQAAVIAACEKHLLTPLGLRSLAPGEPGYVGHYRGGPAERDGAYHQGTVWGWLLGPFAIAHYRVHRDAKRAAALLSPMLGHLPTHCVGQLSEVFDGDAPHEANGCFAQAWSVAETLRAWRETRFASDL